MSLRKGDNSQIKAACSENKKKTAAKVKQAKSSKSTLGIKSPFIRLTGNGQAYLRLVKPALQ